MSDSQISSPPADPSPNEETTSNLNLTEKNSTDEGKNTETNSSNPNELSIQITNEKPPDTTKSPDRTSAHIILSDGKPNESEKEVIYYRVDNFALIKIIIISYQ